MGSNAEESNSTAKRPAKKSPPVELPPESDIEVTPDEQPVRVQLRTPSSSFDVPGEILGGLSMQWYYTVRNRRRWADSVKAKQSLAQRALTKLDELGISKTMLSELGKAGVVEVKIPYRKESEGWAARILPWEFLLRAAVGKPELTVIRHLDVDWKGHAPPAPLARPDNLLFVKSAPGPLDTYSFDTEQCLVEGSLRLPSEELENPSRSELSAAVAGKKVIHLAGFDLHQGDDLYNRLAVPENRISLETDAARWDGMYLAGETPNDVERVRAEDLAKTLNPKTPHGALVTFNLYHSAARLAAMAVAYGSAAAVGFQDVVDDDLAERFFACFFQQWRTLEWDLVSAFHTAWKRVGVDTGVVLWTAQSLVTQLQTSELRKRTDKPTALEIGPDKENVFRVRVEPNPEINYSLLHNGQGLFETFRFEKYEPRYAHGIKVKVALNMGTESFPYEATFDLDADDPILDIAAHVNLPLTSQLARSLREDVLTSLHVCVSYANRVLYEDTHRVKLLAVNQWCYDRREGGRWLASFVCRAIRWCRGCEMRRRNT